jgi:PKHD-type hydroxylase
MSNYQFAPAPPTDLENNSFVTWDNGFTEEELIAIEQYCEDNLDKQEATIAYNNIDSKIRKSKIGWVENNSKTGWFYDKMAFIARKLNAQFYKFDLYGFVEDFQYTVYDSSDNGNYDWHIDMGANSVVTRKFSMVLQLTDPSEYEGGDLQIMAGNQIETVDKEKGKVVAFPGYVLHKVTPVTQGIRKTIVVWVAGPQFR